MFYRAIYSACKIGFVWSKQIYINFTGKSGANIDASLHTPMILIFITKWNNKFKFKLLTI